MVGIIAFGAFISLCGILFVLFSPQLAAFNSRLINKMPDRMRSVYQTASMGHPYDSEFWVRYNRIGGAVVIGLGCVVMLIGRIIK